MHQFIRTMLKMLVMPTYPTVDQLDPIAPVMEIHTENAEEQIRRDLIPDGRASIVDSAIGPLTSDLPYPSCGHVDCYLAWFHLTHYPYGPQVQSS